LAQIEPKNILDKARFWEIMESLITTLTKNQKYFGKLEEEVKRHLLNHVSEIEIINKRNH